MICTNCKSTFIKADNPVDVSYYAVELCDAHAALDGLKALLQEIEMNTRYANILGQAEFKLNTINALCAIAIKEIA